MFKRIFFFFSKPWNLAILNAVLIMAAIVTNSIYQAFCRPVTWAAVVLALTFCNTIVYPLFRERTILFYISGFISGIATGVFIYCIFFLEHINFLALFLIPFFGLGLIAFIPHFFTLQLVIKHLVKKDRLTRILFISGLAVFIAAGAGFGMLYKQSLREMETFKKSNFTSLDKSFMNEKILGMYFKYHTEFCEYDGWRPPLHDPALVIGQWFNGREDPLSSIPFHRLELAKRIPLYKACFPEEPVKLDCSCASQYSSTYHGDPLFKQK
jgi:hypothetical protein